MKHKIYVASSWKNYIQAGVVDALRRCGHEVYDFRHPAPGNEGFRWRDVDLPVTETGGILPGNTAEYLLALRHPVAERGFRYDMDALEAADICLLVLPCGRSAHLEAGYAKGLGKKLFILLGEEVIPELMYKMADHIFPEFHSMLDFFATEGEI